MSELGREDDALPPGEEAVQIRRDLANQNRAAFAPAVANLAEGIQVLTGPLQHLPAAHAPVMRFLARNYLRLSEATSNPPDEALLAPVSEVLQRPQNP